MDYAKMIDHTLLKPEASETQIKKLCEEAREYGFHSVCVNSCYVSYCTGLLKDSDVKVCTVIGFPLGAASTAGKAAEAAAAVKDGAEELDMVINVGMIKSGDWDYVRRDIEAVVRAAGKAAIVKVILETCLLTDEEKRRACRVCREAGDIFCDVIRYGAPPVQQVILHIGFLVFCIGHRFGQTAPASWVHCFKP